MTALLYVGCAGWSLPREHWPAFAQEGTHLERYATRFNSVEINSSFYRPHLPMTYARWASSVPPGFHFSVKLPTRITHEQRLLHCSVEEGIPTWCMFDNTASGESMADALQQLERLPH